ncbi:TPA: superantigen-like protein SSL14 [Staphylococcus argenteus]|uniref:superantigen-like protein SSL14 n=1 Tax=Staphylococcus argenteus TaxID=985002 RepID=UPI000503BF88|nr:superantigen-like protein SSL14 [Staphylococcus argenteus]MBE2135415.1 superantigen-like protein SSL14 [Staphylococcus argenteus]MDT3005556.1 superantigen-like protein SSL14 [Staphylococcus argenteus]UPO21878.1 superantigen-like protein SSL14 [Staphylococcus argenteus]CDR63243.1 exotoxin [Staphylococcus argenteus]HDY9444687.1 superantigen-like protein SSL14 [Staphylococcus argenteus]
MKKNITQKIVLSTALLLLGTTSAHFPNASVSFSSEAKAYNISENETNINELIKYYTQPHLSFSGKWLWQKPNGTIHATLQTWVWYSHIQIYGPESWGNINKLRDKYVDIFGTKDEETVEGYLTYDETFTGGVTPAATSSDKPYKLFVKYSDKQQTIIGGHEVYQGNKPVLTLKELDFRVRQTLIKNKKLYNDGYNKGKINITGGGNNYTIDLSKKLKLTDTNRYVKDPRNVKIEVILEKSN